MNISPHIEEFFNKVHSSSTGRFATSSGGSGGSSGGTAKPFVGHTKGASANPPAKPTGKMMTLRHDMTGPQGKMTPIPNTTDFFNRSHSPADGRFTSGGRMGGTINLPAKSGSRTREFLTKHGADRAGNPYKVGVMVSKGASTKSLANKVKIPSGVAERLDLQKKFGKDAGGKPYTVHITKGVKTKGGKISAPRDGVNEAIRQ